MDYDLVTLAGPETVAGEEIAINGVPCFQWTAMVIPADAVSRNTITGKKGPTYYSGRRMRQYYTDNTRLLEDMKASGQKVTVYPRHAAALMESALPIGWVDHYELRPSKQRPGMEDMWYVATAPLTSEGVDMRMKMRSDLVQFSSLRTFPPPRLRTEPVKLNGQIVEEAVDLPIAGIDLVATQPGLPVDPIRVLEEAEAATIESLDPPAVDTTAAVAPASTPAPTEKTTMRHKCPACQADIDAAVDGAVAFATHAAAEENKTLTESLEKQKAKRKAVEAELETLKQGQSATEEAKNTAIMAELAAVKAQLDAVTEENKALASVKSDFAAMQARDAVTTKVRDMLAKDQDQGFAKFIKGDFKQAVEEALAAGGTLNDHQIDAIYWRVRSEHTPAYFAQRTSKPAGYGHVTLGSGAGSSSGSRIASEEDDDEQNDGRGSSGNGGKRHQSQPTHAGARRGAVEEDDGDDAGSGRPVKLNRTQLDALGIMSRMRGS